MADKDLITRLLNSAKESSKENASFDEEEAYFICAEATKIFRAQPMLLRLDDTKLPIKVFGDIHGQFQDLVRVLKGCEPPPNGTFLFLGDYVDRGPQSLETIMLLYAYKVKHPDNVFLLRGNHETLGLNRSYGFKAECEHVFGDDVLWRQFNESFNFMPLAAIISNKIFCCHGGIPHEKRLRRLEQIEHIERPLDIESEGLANDLIWADPGKFYAGFRFNECRRTSVIFGKEALLNFLERFDLQVVCRAHQVQTEGYELLHHNKLITLFSAPNYTNQKNKGAFMIVTKVGDTLTCSFFNYEQATTRGFLCLSRESKQKPFNAVATCFVSDRKST